MLFGVRVQKKLWKSHSSKGKKLPLLWKYEMTDMTG